MKLIQASKIDMTHFAVIKMKSGDPVFHEGELIGLSLNTVKNIDLSKHVLMGWEVPLYSKIQILVEGEVFIRLPKSWKLPKYQKLYANKNRKITWRRTEFKVGKTLLEQNEDGYCKIRVDIR